MTSWIRSLIWLGVSAAGGWSYYILCASRGEPINSAYVVVAALCTYAIAYRFYAKWLAASVLTLNDRRATPCETHEDGRDFVKTNRWIVFGHHFAAISGPGPLVGPVLAAQFGYLPGLLWILIGVTLGGAVQDFVILTASMRRRGKSLGQMVREELNGWTGAVCLAAILAILIILLAVLALIIVTTLAESPWGVFTVGATIPVALAMGGYLRWIRPGKTLEASVMGVLCLLVAVIGGRWVHQSPELARWFTLPGMQLAWLLIAYGLAASILPVWLLLAPRDYLSTFMKLGTILALAGGVLLVLPTLKMPAITAFVDGSGPVVPGRLFPFCFITIACGAISGFHSLVASGITPKIIPRESDARMVGYGAMCLESLVAVMALVAACCLEPGVYLAINIKGAGPDATAIALDTVAKVQASGYTVTPETMSALAGSVGEPSLYGKTGGAATLAVGMASLFSQVTQGRWLDLWYHFAIMFEALFILTTLDAGTRVGRYLLQDFIGQLWKPLGDTRSVWAGGFASLLVVGGWGGVLITGLLNPDGGTKALWPIFGIANQLLAAIALCLAVTILLKQGLKRRKAAEPGHGPALAWVAAAPLAVLLVITFTAGIQKIFHPSPKIGFAAMTRVQAARIAELEKAASDAPGGLVSPTVAKGLRAARTAMWNAQFDLAITAVFLGFAALLTGLSAFEWAKLLTGNKLAELKEEPPVWLSQGREPVTPVGTIAGAAAIAWALLRHWSGSTDVERAQTDIAQGRAHGLSQRLLIDTPEVRTAVEHSQASAAYKLATERRSNGSTPCC